MRRWILAALTACAVGGSLTGCSGGDGGDGGSGTKAGPEVTWASSVCSAVGGKNAQLQMPAVDSKNYVKAKEGIVTFLGQISTQLSTMETNLRGVGAPPNAEAKPLYDTTLTRIATTRTAVDKTATTLKSAKVTDKVSLTTALTGLAGIMTKYQDYQGPIADLKASPTLSTAFASAPACSGVS
ncbi:hypothetical protein [Actinocorallia longicatena]|uniref:Lipoprotein n=1 Tax=Actinocorallia longicatena TaxID=111803 RepID=A0ABP6QLU2_9ACTN